MNATERKIVELSLVEAAAEGRRAQAAREVRVAKKERLALSNYVLQTRAGSGSKKAAPRGRKGGEVRKSETHSMNIPNGRGGSKAKSKQGTRTGRKGGVA